VGSVYGTITARSGTLAGRSMAPRRTLVALPSLAYWRTRRTLLQRELAERANLNIRSLQRIEADGLASLDTARRLAEALEVKPERLMRQPAES
jgi:DNA-binding XRE family transcriptional regulator